MSEKVAMLGDCLEARKQKLFQLKIVIFTPADIMNRSVDAAFLEPKNSSNKVSIFAFLNTSEELLPLEEQRYIQYK